MTQADKGTNSDGESANGESANGESANGDSGSSWGEQHGWFRNLTAKYRTAVANNSKSTVIRHSAFSIKRK